MGIRVRRRARTPRAEPQQHAARARPGCAHDRARLTARSPPARRRRRTPRVREHVVDAGSPAELSGTAPRSRPWSIRAGCSRSRATSGSARSEWPRRRTTHGTSRSAAKRAPAGEDDFSSSYEVATAGSASCSTRRGRARLPSQAKASSGSSRSSYVMRWRTSTPWRRPRRRPAVTVVPVDGNGDAPVHVSAELETSGAPSA